MKRQKPIEAAVKRAVLEWANAATLAHGRQILGRHRAAIRRDLVGQLTDEIAAISVETLVRSLAKTSSQEPPAVSFAGTSLGTAQAECAGAWIHNQLAIAEALGLPARAWNRQLQSALASFLGQDTGATGDRNPSTSRSLRDATRLLGTEQRFEPTDRPVLTPSLLQLRLGDFESE